MKNYGKKYEYMYINHTSKAINAIFTSRQNDNNNKKHKNKKHNE